MPGVPPTSGSPKASVASRPPRCAGLRVRAVGTAVLVHRDVSSHATPPCDHSSFLTAPTCALGCLRVPGALSDSILESLCRSFKAAWPCWSAAVLCPYWTLILIAPQRPGTDLSNDTVLIARTAVGLQRLLAF
ncbi:hypothetical protein NDU88_003358 [Pleurodeles waltl]|uniref:Uncharacterized protein n=1 Tax=Pleurodeles waltl TaxID=8319 RepID=A0AAV7SEH2_PLEWA|nr:hypothetical protein NDU88_003358 [Pleurodeles waltl]